MKSAYKWQITNDKFAYIIDEGGFNKPFIYTVSTQERNYEGGGETEEVSEQEIIVRVNAMTTPTYQDAFEEMVSLVHSDIDGQFITFLPFEYYYNIDGDSCIAVAKEIVVYDTSTDTKTNDDGVASVEGNVYDTINGQKVSFSFGLPRGPQGSIGDIDTVTVTGYTGDTAYTHIEPVSDTEKKVFIATPIGPQGSQGPRGSRGYKGNVGNVNFEFVPLGDEESEDNRIETCSGPEGKVETYTDDDDAVCWRFTLPKGFQGDEGNGNVEILSLYDYMEYFCDCDGGGEECCECDQEENENNVENKFYAIRGAYNRENVTGIYLQDKLIYPYKYFKNETSGVTITDEPNVTFKVLSNLNKINATVINNPDNLISENPIVSNKKDYGFDVTAIISGITTGSTPRTAEIKITDGENAPLLFMQEEIFNIRQTKAAPKIYSILAPSTVTDEQSSAVTITIDANVGPNLTVSSVTSSQTGITDNVSLNAITGQTSGERRTYSGTLRFSGATNAVLNRTLTIDFASTSPDTGATYTGVTIDRIATNVKFKLQISLSELAGTIFEDFEERRDSFTPKLWVGIEEGSRTITPISSINLTELQQNQYIEYNVQNLMWDNDTVYNLILYTSNKSDGTQAGAQSEIIDIRGTYYRFSLRCQSDIFTLSREVNDNNGNLIGSVYIESAFFNKQSV